MNNTNPSIVKQTIATQAIADQAQRERALDTQDSFIVQAPAGSGKTELLTRRFLVLLGQAVNQPEEIIALTFTRKAAGEMRQRIMAALQKAQHAAEPDNDYERATWQLAKQVVQRDQAFNWGLLNTPNRLRIQTIDALCASITRQMPTLSRLGPTPEIMVDPNVAYHAAATNVVSLLEEDESALNLLNPAAIETLLMHLDNRLQTLIDLLTAMLARRDQWLPHIMNAHQHQRFDSEKLRAQLENTLQQIVLEKIQALQRQLDGELLAELTLLANFAANNLDREFNTQLESTEDWRWLCELLLTKDGQWRKTVNKNTGFPAASTIIDEVDSEQAKRLKKRMLDLLAHLRALPELHNALHDLAQAPPSHYRDDQWQVLAALIELLPIAAAQLKVIFQQQSQCDFSEIAQAALLALGAPEQPTELGLSLDYRIQHVLVDEFQDTSASQFRLLERLTHDWHSGDGRTLFLVGDPMQSIYRFREAEVGLFLQARQQGIGDVHLQALTLQVNFRSQAALVTWFNDTFTDVFPQQEDMRCGAVAYTPAIAFKGASDATAAVELSGFDAQNDDNAVQQGAYIVTQIQQAQQYDPQTSIAVLVRARSHLSYVLPALQQASIAYQAHDIESLQVRAVIRDLVALTRALLHPADRTAWLAILRAPWCALSLADLHVLAQPAEHCLLDNLRETHIIESLSHTGQTQLRRVLPVILASLAERYRKPLAQWIEGVWLALGGPACLSDASDIDNAATFFALLAELDIGGDCIDFRLLEDRLRDLFAKPKSVEDSTQAPVQVMTIHKSKGLEFDHVIIPCLELASAADSNPLLRWLEYPSGRGEPDLLLAPMKAFHEKHDAIYRYLQREENTKAQHEMSRLLYVALTRAKQRLYLLASMRFDEDVTPIKPGKRSLLAQLWSSCAADFVSSVKDDETIAKLPTASSSSVKTGRFARLRGTLDINIETPEAVSSGKNHPQRLQTLITKYAQPASDEMSSLVACTTPEPNKCLPNKRLLGTFIHQQLQHIANIGVGAWFAIPIAERQAHWRVQLCLLGMSENDIAAALLISSETLHRVTHDERGRWILDNQHQEAYTEYAVTMLHNEKVQHLVIDRTFVADGVRWIIDYKTAHSGLIGTDSHLNDQALNTFLAREKQLHRAQLQRYAQAMQQLDSRPIRLGLYFPLHAAWVEWEHEWTL